MQVNAASGGSMCQRDRPVGCWQWASAEALLQCYFVRRFMQKLGAIQVYRNMSMIPVLITAPNDSDIWVISRA